MRALRRRRPILLVVALLAACGRREPELPRLPAAHEVLFPDDGSPVAFHLAAADVALVPGEPARSWRLVIGEEGWVWLGHAGDSKAQLEVGDARELAGTRAVALPAAEVAWRGRLGALLEAFFPEQASLLLAAPAQLQVGAWMVSRPEDDAMARDLALALGLVSLAADWLPGMLRSECRGVIRELEEAPSLDAVFAVASAPAEAVWAEPWVPGRLPQGFALLRLEAQGPQLWERMAGILERWGYDPPPAPVEDFGAELHAIELQGSIGLVLALRAGWELGLTSWWTRGIGDFADLGDLGRLFLEELGDVAWERCDAEGGAFLALGDSTFRTALRAALERDRPPPFAERRWRWPRGSAILLLDLRGLESALGSLAPVALPRIQAGGATERIVELVVTIQDGDVRMHGSWPPAERRQDGLGGLAQDGARGLSALMLQELFGGLVSPAEGALDQLEPVIEEGAER